MDESRDLVMLPRDPLLLLGLWWPWKGVGLCVREVEEGGGVVLVMSLREMMVRLLASS